MILPNRKLLLQQSPAPWRLIKEEGSGDANAGKPLPTRNGLLSVIHQPLAGQRWVERRHRVPEPWPCTVLDKQLDARLLWCTSLSPHLARAQHLRKRYPHSAWERCLRFPYSQSKLSSSDPCYNPETWEASTSQKKEQTHLCLVTWTF